MGRAHDGILALNIRSNRVIKNRNFVFTEVLRFPSSFLLTNSLLGCATPLSISFLHLSLLLLLLLLPLHFFLLSIFFSFFSNLSLFASPPSSPLLLPQVMISRSFLLLLTLLKRRCLLLSNVFSWLLHKVFSIWIWRRDWKDVLSFYVSI